MENDFSKNISDMSAIISLIEECYKFEIENRDIITKSHNLLLNDLMTLEQELKQKKTMSCKKIKSFFNESRDYLINIYNPHIDRKI